MTQRRDLRLNINQPQKPVNLAIHTAQAAEPGFQILNLSRSGFFMRGETNLAVGKEVEATIILPNQDFPIKVVGQVSWVKPLQDPSAIDAQGFGVRVKEFVDNAEDSWQQWFADVFSQHRLSDLSPKRFFSLSHKDQVFRALQIYAKNSDCFIVVTNDDNQPLGILGSHELLKLALDPTKANEALGLQVLNQVTQVEAAQSTASLLRQLLPESQHFFAITREQKMHAIIDLPALLPFWIESLRLEKESTERRLRNGLSVVAHELKSPLTIIDTANKMLLSENLSDKEYISSGLPQIVEENCHTIDSLIDDLLILSNPGVKRALVKSQVNLLEVCKRVVEEFRIITDDKGQQISFITSLSNEPKIHTDQRKLRQILHNLLSNAIKFSPQGAHTRLYLEDMGGHYGVRIVDQGPGIASSDMETIFREFSGVKNEPTGNEKSTGIGLSIAQKLAHSIGAELKVKSERGRGAEFSVILPQQPP